MTAQIENMAATNKTRPTRAFSGGPRMKRSITSTLSLGILVLLLTWSSAYAANKQVATVVAARGDVQAVDAKGKSRPLPVQAPILEEDTIKTGEHSRVQIMFADNTLINLGNATTMKIAEYRWQPEQNDGALKTQVKEGTFRVMGGALTKTAPQNFKTETPTATIGIRGSMYAGVVTPEFLSVLFQGGKGIEITNAFGTVEISKPGYGTKVAMAKPPLPPMKFTAKEMGEMNKALSGNGKNEKEEKKEDKKEKGEDKGKKEDKGQEKAPAPKAGQSAAPAPTPESAPAGTGAVASWDTAPLEPPKDIAPPLPPPLPTPPPLIPPVPYNIKTNVVIEKAQAVADTTTTDTAATTVVNSTALSGNYRFFLRDVDMALPDPGDFHSTFLVYDAGTVGVKLIDTGELYGTLSDGTSFGPYQITGYNPNATSYSGFATFTDTITFPDPTVGSLNLTVNTVGEPSGQFFYNTFYYTIDSVAPDSDFLLAQLLYAGIPSTSIPASGIDMFTGHLVYNSTSSASFDADMEKTSIEVSYYNRRLIGRSSDMNPAITKNDGAIFFGTVNSNGTADIIILGGGGASGTSPTATYGTASANLYGSFNQGLGFTASGADYVIIDNTLHSTWQATGAALRDATTEIISSYPTSPIPYTGFVVGVADNTATGAASRIFMNSAASGFTMSANPTTGVVSGSLSADEILFGGSPLGSITIGHATDLTKSAYVLNDQMVAILSDADPNYALSSYGNFLYTAGPDAPLITNASNEYMTWGYWEMAYTDTDSSKDHLFSSQSFFVAGQQTPIGYLNSILGTASFTGTYDGKAFGVQLDATGQNATQLTNGATHLVVNFPANLAANSVTGTISFDQASLAINSAANSLGNTGFNAYVSTVSGTAPSSSAVNGAFFGPNAEAVGGNFHALMGTGVRYLGVFGGNR